LIHGIHPAEPSSAIVVAGGVHAERLTIARTWLDWRGSRRRHAVRRRPNAKYASGMSPTDETSVENDQMRLEPRTSLAGRRRKSRSIIALRMVSTTPARSGSVGFVG
jgi:hypothetical protein